MALFSNPEPSTDELTLLAIGDVHLGTRPSSLPEDLHEQGVDPRALTPETALLAAVERAIEEDVDAVLFAGDVVESTNAHVSKPCGRSKSAVRRLFEAGIPVLGVVGNHDVEALPRLAGLIEGFELIGRDGRWQRRVIEKHGRPAVEILGWSFPERQVRSSPVAELLRNPIEPRHPGTPRIGLLHGDLDASGGSYAPFSSRELDRAGLDAWLLGHIHKPSLAQGTVPDGSGPRGYLGSLVGLDPGEMGPHGPWLVRVSRAGEVVPQQLAIAPLRWERFDLRVAEDEGLEDIGVRLLEEAERFARDLQAQGAVPQVLGLRPRLVGPTRHYDALHRRINDAGWRGLTRWVGDTFVFIDKVLDGLGLVHDLAELALGSDPPALLARKLLILEKPGEQRSALIEATRRELGGLAAELRWSALEDEQQGTQDPLSDDDALAALLTRSGTAALSQLLSQTAPITQSTQAALPVQPDLDAGADS